MGKGESNTFCSTQTEETNELYKVLEGLLHFIVMMLKCRSSKYVLYTILYKKKFCNVYRQSLTKSPSGLGDISVLGFILILVGVVKIRPKYISH